MPLYDYLTPKLDFKRKFNHRQCGQSFLYKGRLTKISNRIITTNRIPNRKFDSKSNRISKLRRSLSKLGLNKIFFTALGGVQDGAPTAPPGYAYGCCPGAAIAVPSATRCRWRTGVLLLNCFRRHRNVCVRVFSGTSNGANLAGAWCRLSRQALQHMSCLDRHASPAR